MYFPTISIRVHHSTERDYKWKNIYDQLPIFPGVDIPANSPQGQTMQFSKKLEKPESSISGSTGLTEQQVKGSKFRQFK